MAQRGIPTAGALPGPARPNRHPAVPAGPRAGTRQHGTHDSLPAPIRSAPTALQSYRHPKGPCPISTSTASRDNTQAPKHRHLIKPAALSLLLLLFTDQTSEKRVEKRNCCLHKYRAQHGGGFEPTGSRGGNAGTRRHSHTQTHAPGQLEAGGQVSPSPLKAPGFSSAMSWDHQDVTTTPGSGTPSVEAARGQLLPRCSVPVPCRGNWPLAPHPWVLVRSRTGRSCQQCRQGSHT